MDSLKHMCIQKDSLESMRSSMDRMFDKIDKIGSDIADIRVCLAELRPIVKQIEDHDRRLRTLELDRSNDSFLATKKQFYLATFLAISAIVATLFKELFFKG